MSLKKWILFDSLRNLRWRRSGLAFQLAQPFEFLSQFEWVWDRVYDFQQELRGLSRAPQRFKPESGYSKWVLKAVRLKRFFNELYELRLWIHMIMRIRARSVIDQKGSWISLWTIRQSGEDGSGTPVWTLWPAFNGFSEKLLLLSSIDIVWRES